MDKISAQNLMNISRSFGMHIIRMYSCKAWLWITHVFFAENLKDNNFGLAALIASNYVHLIKVTECWILHLLSKDFRGPP